MGKQLTFLSPIVIYRFPEETREITCDTEPIGAVIIDAPEQWVAAVNEVIEKQREVFMKYLEYKPVDEKYAELRERLAVKQIEASQLGGELRFSITYDLADGPQVQPTLLRDYAAVHLMTCSYLASTDAVGFHRGKLFAFDLDPAEDEPIPGVERDNLFEAITITKNKLLMPEEITPMSKHQMQQTPSM